MSLPVSGLHQGCSETTLHIPDRSWFCLPCVAGPAHPITLQLPYLPGTTSLAAYPSSSGLQTVVQSLPWELADNAMEAPRTSLRGQGSACQASGRVWIEASHSLFTGSFGETAYKPSSRKSISHQERQTAKEECRPGLHPMA